MPAFISFILAIVGAAALSLLTYLYHFVFFREALRDGQYFFVFFFTAPLGAVLGGVTGLSIGLLRKHKALQAARVSLIGGLCILFLITQFCVMYSRMPLAALVGAIAFYWALPAIWSIILVISGAVLLRKSRKLKMRDLPGD